MAQYVDCYCAIACYLLSAVRMRFGGSQGTGSKLLKAILKYHVITLQVMGIEKLNVYSYTLCLS